MKENQFERWHPFTQFVYFAAVITLITVHLNPIITGITLVSVIFLGALMKKREFVKILFVLYIPASVLAIIINPLFSHEGVTILQYFPSGNPLTLESVMYGIVSGGMVCSICVLFFSFNTVMTSDRLMYLTGKIMPAIALTISMSLRFVPEFKRHMTQVNRLQGCIGKKGGRIKNGLAVFESMVMWSFEKSIERSDSMRARGYGVKKRTFYSKYKFSRTDIAYTVLILFLFVFVFTNILCGNIYSQYYPYFKISGSGQTAVLTYVAYAFLTVMPALDIIKENIRWKSLKSRI